MTKLKWWESYADAPVEFSGQCLFVLSEEDVDRCVPRMKVLECQTWGDVRALGTDIHAEVLGLAGYGEYDELVAHFSIQGVAPNLTPSPILEAEHVLQGLEDLPDDADPFDAYDDLGACADGDWPPSVFYLVANAVPSDILDAFGERWFTTFNGTYGILDAGQREAIFQAFAAAGDELSEDSRIGDLISTY